MPWIMWLRSRFILLIVERKWDPKSLSGNLWSQELGVSFPCNFRIIYLIKPLTAEIWSYVTLPLRCMKTDLLRKESAIKNCHKFSSKKIYFKFQVYKKDRSQLRSIHSVWECRTEPSKTKHSRKSSHSFKVRPLVGNIETNLLPRATLIQFSEVRLNYFKVSLEVA